MAHYNAVDMISSRANPTVSEAASLSDRKYRDKAELFILDGIKLIEEAALAGCCVRYVMIRGDVMDRYYETVVSMLPKVRVIALSEPAFERVSDEKSPQGVVAAVKYSSTIRSETTAESYNPAEGGILILDEVQNPDNLGAIMRSARAFGMKNVICGKGCADVYGRRVMRASMGAALHLKTVYTDDTAETVKKLASAGRRVIVSCLDESARSLTDFKFDGNDAIIVGNEGHGASDEVIAAATDKLYIPMVKGQESLNAAAAASVILWEYFRECGKVIT